MRIHEATRRLRFTLVVILSAIALGVGSLPLAQAQNQSSSECGSGYNVFTSSGATSNMTITGTTNILLASPTTAAPTITKVIFKANNQIIGRAQPNATFSWSMPWVTNLFSNGPAQLSADVFFSNSVQSCTVNGLAVTVLNPTASALNGAVSPQKWDGPMSFGFPVSIQPTVINPSFDPTPYSVFTWTTTIGNVTPNNQIAQYFSGQAVGTGAISVKVSYGGKEFVAAIPVTVRSANAPLPEPTTSQDTTTPSQTNSTPPSVIRESTLQNNPVAQDCVVSALGTERFNAINAGIARPTLAEIQKFKDCFATSNYILPSNFAPVLPATIKELSTNKILKVKKPSNATRTTESGDVEVLTLSGKAKPNSIVIIYVFSDPLVLTTTTNENGEWTYILEDPIEPGNHEVYSVVDRGDGVYERSEPLSFLIGTAEAAEDNPNGLSLRLEEEPTPAQSNRSMLLFVAASMIIVLVILISFILLFRYRAKRSTAVMQQDGVQQFQVPTTISPPTVQSSDDDSVDQNKQL